MPMRRAITAADRLRRPRRLGRKFTATVHTTTCGAPAVLDTWYKNARRKVLDRKIGSPSRNLVQLRRLSSSIASNQDAKERAPSTSHLLGHAMRPSLSEDPIGILMSICKMDDALIRHAESRPVFGTFLQTMHKSYDPKEKLGDSNFFSMGPNFDMVADSINEEYQPGGVLHREPLTNQQFERYHDMMNKLVDSLIIQSYYDETPGDPEAARRSLDSLDSAWTAIRLLRSEGYPRYNHPGVDPTAAEKGRANLTAMLRKLFDSWNETTRSKYQVAKICYNLLVCPVPPSIHHYNTLILGFTRKRMHHLSDLVVESLLDESRLRPNSQTVACLLLHYQHKNDLLGFYGIIRRMMAIDNRGLLTRRRWYEETLQIPDLRKWAKQPEVTTSLKGNWVIERPMRNRDIYEGLVCGLLHFGRVKDAAKVFVASLQEKWGISVELFIQLLRQCLYTLDAPAADILVRGFIGNAGVMTALILRENCPRKLAEHLYPLLNIGKPPSWPFSEKRASMAWHSASLAITAEDRLSIRRLTVAMFIRQAETHLLRLHHIIRRIKRIMNIALTPRARMDYAQMGMGELLSVSLHNRQLAARLLKHQALLKIARELEESTWDIVPRKLATTYNDVVLVLERSIPRPARPGGWEHFEDDEEITLLAGQWMRYRLSRMHGIRSEAARTELDAELALVMARRLVGLVRGILIRAASMNPAVESDHVWKPLTILHGETRQPAQIVTHNQAEEADFEDVLSWPAIATVEAA
ncbi:hypothetical protein N8I77_005656 [Diaporthe amygdali]|uniref:Pentatricopeptide repeat domain-containing protein n=1 Tax=Phomopsis amygdali TaxID=1214568 RepID=A0AAD9W4Y9_PHOAM|nr:hypothetical protein N8I77_005656 [Diaporthe amygdali]